MRTQSPHRRPLVFSSILLGAATAGLAAHAAATVPTGIAYSGVLRDHGAPASGAFDLSFQLVRGDGTSAGCPTDERNDAPVAGGRFGVADLFAACAGLDGILATESSLAIRVTVEGQLLSPDQPLGSAPFAARARVAENGVLGGTANAVAKYSAPGVLAASAINEESGDVGMGVAPQSPFRLRVFGPAKIGNKGGQGGLAVDTDENGRALYTSSTSAAEVRIVSDGRPAPEGITVKHGGNVGIGTTSPDALLSVNGAATKPGGGSWGTYSDDRLKHRLGAYAPGLEEVSALTPFRYRYRDDNALGIRDGAEHVGISAQEVERLIPQAVKRNAKGYRVVDNDPILWAMLNAIRELKEENRELRARLVRVEKKPR